MQEKVELNVKEGKSFKKLLESLHKTEAEDQKLEEALEYFDLNHFDSMKKEEEAPTDLMGTLSELIIKNKVYTCVHISSNFENAEKDLELLTSVQHLAAIPKILSIKKGWKDINILFENIGTKVSTTLPAFSNRKLLENLLSGIELIEYLYLNDVPHNPLSPDNTFVDARQNLKFLDLSALDQGSFMNNLRLNKPTPEGIPEMSPEAVLPLSFLKRDKTFDSEDLMLTDIYGLGLTLLFMVDKEIAAEGMRADWNKNPKVMNEVLEKYLEKKKLDVNLAFLLSHILMPDPLRRPTIEILQFLSKQILDISLLSEALKDESKSALFEAGFLDQFQTLFNCLNTDFAKVFFEDKKVSEETEAKLVETLKKHLPREILTKTFLNHLVTRYREEKRPFFCVFEYLARLAEFTPLL